MSRRKRGQRIHIAKSVDIPPSLSLGSARSLAISVPAIHVHINNFWILARIGFATCPLVPSSGRRVALDQARRAGVSDFYGETRCSLNLQCCQGVSRRSGTGCIFWRRGCVFTASKDALRIKPSGLRPMGPTPRRAQPCARSEIL